MGETHGIAVNPIHSLRSSSPPHTLTSSPLISKPSSCTSWAARRTWTKERRSSSRKTVSRGVYWGKDREESLPSEFSTVHSLCSVAAARRRQRASTERRRRRVDGRIPFFIRLVVALEGEVVGTRRGVNAGGGLVCSHPGGRPSLWVGKEKDVSQGARVAWGWGWGAVAWGLDTCGVSLGVQEDTRVRRAAANTRHFN